MSGGIRHVGTDERNSPTADEEESLFVEFPATGGEWTGEEKPTPVNVEAHVVSLERSGKVLPAIWQSAGESTSPSRWANSTVASRVLLRSSSQTISFENVPDRTGISLLRFRAPSGQKKNLTPTAKNGKVISKMKLSIDPISTI